MTVYYCTPGHPLPGCRPEITPRTISTPLTASNTTLPYSWVVGGHGAGLAMVRVVNNVIPQYLYLLFKGGFEILMLQNLPSDKILPRESSHQ